LKKQLILLKPPKSDDEVSKHLIVRNVLIGPTRFGELLFQKPEVRRVLRFDTDQYGAEIARRFLQIFETRNIILGSQKIEERTKRARPLRKAEDEIFLQSFETKRTLAHIRQALEIKIAARNNNNDPLALYIALL